MRRHAMVAAIGFGLLLTMAAALWTIHSEWQGRSDALAKAYRALKECAPGKVDGSRYGDAVFRCEVHLAAGEGCC
jgi:hypothetical protein